MTDQVRGRPHIVFVLVAFTACFGVSGAGEPTHDLEYAVAPSGGASYVGVLTTDAETWSFAANVPEGWRWRRLSPPYFRGNDVDGVQMIAPDAGASDFEPGGMSPSKGVACETTIGFALTAPLEGETQETINERERAIAREPHTGTEAFGRFRFNEAIEAGGYVGLYRQWASLREDDSGKSVAAVYVLMSWEVSLGVDYLNLVVLSKCEATVGIDGPPLDARPVIADMIAFARSTTLIPPATP